MGRVRSAGRPRGIPHLTPTLSAPRGGEGDFELRAYCFENAWQVLHHIVVPETDQAITSASDFLSMHLVCFQRNACCPPSSSIASFAAGHAKSTMGLPMG